MCSQTTHKSARIRICVFSGVSCRVCSLITVLLPGKCPHMCVCSLSPVCSHVCSRVGVRVCSLSMCSHTCLPVWGLLSREPGWLTLSLFWPAYGPVEPGSTLRLCRKLPLPSPLESAHTFQVLALSKKPPLSHLFPISVGYARYSQQPGCPAST